MFLGFGQFGRPPGGLFPPQAFEASDQKQAYPLVHGLGCDTQRQRDYASARGEGGVYTPQAVINGSRGVIGSDRAAVLI